MKLTAKILKTVLWVAVFLVIAFLLWRIFLINSDHYLGDVTPTDNARAAYAELGKDAFFTNSLPDRISGNDDGADGYFSAYSFVYVPDKKEAQITLRINDSTSEKLSLPEGELPYFYLKFNENGTDTGDIRHSVHTETEHHLMYSYVRLVFDRVEITDVTNLIICLSESGDASLCTSELVIHFQEQKLEPLRLSSGEKKSLSSGE